MPNPLLSTHMNRRGLEPVPYAVPRGRHRETSVSSRRFVASAGKTAIIHNIT